MDHFTLSAPCLTIMYFVSTNLPAQQEGAVTLLWAALSFEPETLA